MAQLAHAHVVAVRSVSPTAISSPPWSSSTAPARRAPASRASRAAAPPTRRDRRGVAAARGHHRKRAVGAGAGVAGGAAGERRGRRCRCGSIGSLAGGDRGWNERLAHLKGGGAVGECRCITARPSCKSRLTRPRSTGAAHHRRRRRRRADVEGGLGRRWAGMEGTDQSRRSTRRRERQGNGQRREGRCESHEARECPHAGEFMVLLRSVFLVVACVRMIGPLSGGTAIEYGPRTSPVCERYDRSRPGGPSTSSVGPGDGTATVVASHGWSVAEPCPSRRVVCRPI